MGFKEEESFSSFSFSHLFLRLDNKLLVAMFFIGTHLPSSLTVALPPLLTTSDTRRTPVRVVQVDSEALGPQLRPRIEWISQLVSSG